MLSGPVDQPSSAQAQAGRGAQAPVHGVSSQKDTGMIPDYTKHRLKAKVQGHEMMFLIGI